MRLIRSSLLVQIHEPFPQRIQRGLRAVGQVQLAEDVADVGAHRPLADDEPVRDLRVGQTLRNQLQDDELAAGQRVLGGGRVEGRFNSLISFSAMLGCSEACPPCTSWIAWISCAGDESFSR